MDSNGIDPAAQTPKPFAIEPNGTGEQFEYHRVTITGPNDPVHSFNQLGAVGWQVIGMQPVPQPDGGMGLSCWIMRRKPGSAISRPVLHLPPNGRR